MGTPLVVVVKGWPRLSETFIAEEIAGLEARGFDLHLVSLRQPTDHLRHPVHGRVRAPVLYLPEYPARAPLRLWRAFRRARALPGFSAAWAAFRADLARVGRGEHVARSRRFAQGVVMAAELPQGFRHCHIHFLHTPASVGRYAALMRGMSYSLSAHARDIWTSRPWDLAVKLDGARFTTCCTRHGTDVLQALTTHAVNCLHHGIHPDRFVAAPPDSRRDGSDAADPVRLLCVARLVEKKGHADLFAALSRLPAALAWHLDLIGGGPLKADLATLAADLGIAGRITFHGAQAQGQVIAAYRAADIKVLAARIAGDGDRDGLPNVLVEAQASGLPVIASRVSAIPELIEDGRNGVLVPPGDHAALADALAGLIGRPDRRHALGQAGQARVLRDFGAAASLDRLADLLRPLAGPG